MLRFAAAGLWILIGQTQRCAQRFACSECSHSPTPLAPAGATAAAAATLKAFSWHLFPYPQVSATIPDDCSDLNLFNARIGDDGAKALALALMNTLVEA